MYKVLITTSGTGSRLERLTNDNNKSLIEINGKTILERIISIYPKDIEIVLTLGYFDQKVKKYVQNNFPNRKISFKKINKFKGEGSSLGYSMLQTKDLLKIPFIFHCNDTIVKKIPADPEKFNWIAGSKGNDPNIFNSKQYSSLIVKNSKLVKIQPKGTTSYNFLHIGLVGIKDFQSFWQNLEIAYKNNPNDSSLNDVSSINKMLLKKTEFMFFDSPEWLDTGNLEALENARKNLKNI